MSATEHGPADFVIVGGQRCGSTQLGSLLDAHSGISCPYLELPYFEDPFYNVSAESDFHRYVFARTARRHGFKRPEYLSRPEVPQRLYDYNPELRIFTVLRDPVERFLSAVVWYMYVGYTPVKRLAPAVRALTRGWHDGSLNARERELFEFSQYSAGVERYLGLFGQERTTIVCADELFGRGTRSAVLDEVLAALGMTSDVGLLDISGERNASPGNFYRLRVLRWRLPFALSWEKLGVVQFHRRWHWQRPLRLVPLGLVKSLDRAVSVVARSGPDEIDSSTRAELTSIFAPDVENLASVMGRELTWSSRYLPASAETPAPGRFPRLSIEPSSGGVP